MQRLVVTSPILRSPPKYRAALSAIVWLTLASCATTATLIPQQLRQQRHNSDTLLALRDAKRSLGVVETLLPEDDLDSSSPSSSQFYYDIPAKGCSSLTLDPPTLHFVADEPPRIIHNYNKTNRLGCNHIFECKVFSSPPELNILWYRNGRIVKASALRDSTLRSAQEESAQLNNKLNNVGTIQTLESPLSTSSASASSPMFIGLSQMMHRICVDPYLVRGVMNVFQCKIESICQPELTIKSHPMFVQPTENFPSLRQNDAEKNDRKRNNNNNNNKNNDGGGVMGRGRTSAFTEGGNKFLVYHHHRLATPLEASAMRRSSSSSSFTAPLITMITSTRMELAGRDVQVACHASGAPRPTIAWSVIDDNNDAISYPVENFSFINKMPNGDIIVTSSQTTLASVTLRCEARNAYGYDDDTSTIILLDE